MAMQSLAVKVEDISFVGIKGTSATEEAIKFACSETFPCERLYLEDLQLVSYSGESTSSFCWEAQGSCSGRVHPPSCLSLNDSYIEQKVLSSSVLWSIWGCLYYSGNITFNSIQHTYGCYIWSCLDLNWKHLMGFCVLKTLWRAVQRKGTADAAAVNKSQFWHDYCCI